MGGEPKTALNIVAFPKNMDTAILGEILKGGADKVMEAGAVLAGGHTIQDDTPKYGLSVTGFVHPEKFWKNYGAQTGDRLILTKPLGTGIVNTAIKADMVSEEAREATLKSMKTLNRYARDVLKRHTVHACTDVTGFGLGGHGTEMADGSKKYTCDRYKSASDPSRCRRIRLYGPDSGRRISQPGICSKNLVT